MMRKGGRILGHIPYRICQLGEFPPVFYRSSQELANHHPDMSFLFAIVRPGDAVQIGRTKVIENGIDMAGKFLPAPVPLEIGISCRGAQQADQVPPGGTAPYANFLRINMIFLGMCPQPADGCFAIMDPERERVPQRSMCIRWLR